MPGSGPEVSRDFRYIRSWVIVNHASRKRITPAARNMSQSPRDHECALQE